MTIAEHGRAAGQARLLRARSGLQHQALRGGQAAGARGRRPAGARRERALGERLGVALPPDRSGRRPGARARPRERRQPGRAGGVSPWTTLGAGCRAAPAELAALGGRVRMGC